MKVLNILCLIAILFAIGCKSQKIAPKPEPVSSSSFSEPAKSSETTKSKSLGSVTSKEEKVKAAPGESSDFGSKRYYVIIGAFSVYENAQKFKKQLMSEDFFPGILVNEKGLFRVSVNSYDDESMARSRISDIRQKFPKYSDVWLLVKK
jgi:cell division protein FtsN